MVRCNPQGWFPHSVPPTDELKQKGLRKVSACAGRFSYVSTRPFCNRARSLNQ
jgi:hypothetical protein